MYVPSNVGFRIFGGIDSTVPKVQAEFWQSQNSNLNHRPAMIQAAPREFKNAIASSMVATSTTWISSPAASVASR